MKLNAHQKSLEIMIVDDHGVYRKSLSRIVGRLLPGCHISESESGLEFLTKLNTKTYDLVLMDVKMPEIDGIETTQRALSKAPELKILAVSMHDDYIYQSAMKEAGAAGYITKGGDISEIKIAIQVVLNGGTFYSLN